MLSRTHTLRNKSVHWKCILIVVLLEICLLSFFIWSNNALQVQMIAYVNDRIPASFEGYRIVHLSDLHNKVFGKMNQPLLEKVSQLQPDCIVLTGDFVDMSNHTNVEQALLFMRQVPSIAPTYYVLGNHELKMKQKDLQNYLKEVQKAGVQILDDAVIPLFSTSSEQINLIGLSDASLQDATLQNLMDKQDADSFAILLAHEPQFLNSYAETGIDLVFSGHTHGGQFRLPFTNIGIYAPDQGLFPKQAAGVFVKEDTTLVVNRGLGNSAFPLRLWNRPEIICVTLHACATETSTS